MGTRTLQQLRTNIGIFTGACIAFALLFTSCGGGGGQVTSVSTSGTAASITATAGTPQSATISTAFGTALQATVKDSGGNPVSGVSVTFTAPSTGASGTFAGGSATCTTTTNSSGVATATTFTANGTAGSYTVSAAAAGVATAANFSLTNTTAPVASLSLTSLTFDSQAEGTRSAAQTVTLTNIGSATLNIASIVITGPNVGDFAQTNTCGSSVTAGNNCTISVTFAPSLTETETGTVTITDNAADTPQEVSLTGTGVSVTVNWSRVRQTIDGFGGSCADFYSPLTTQLADFFFTTSSGIGLSILRTQIMPDLADCQAWMTSMSAPTSYCIAVASGATALTGEPQVAQQAVARSVTYVWSTSWSPPASMKSNGVFYQGGDFIGSTSNYTNYATALASYVTFMAGYNVPIYAVSPQNEPDISQSYPSALWTAQQFHDFIPYLYAALQTAGYGSTQILFPENSAWSSTYDGFAATAMEDSSVAADVGIMAQHGYAGDSDIVAPTSTYGKHLWMTEDSSQSSTYDGSMTDALGWAAKIHSYLATAQVNAFIWWFLTDMPGNGDGTDNAALTDMNGNIPLRAYVTGNWSKFVRPGWHRVDVANSGPLLVTAFQSASNSQSAVVVVNSGSTDSTQVFGVGTQMGTSVVPWVTSSTQSLAQQTPVTMSNGLLTYTVPASSVVTFVGAATD